MMANEPTPVTPLVFKPTTVFSIEGAWPERTSVMPMMLARPEIQRVAYDEQARTVTFDVFNGSATYHLTGETEPNGALVAERVEHKRTGRKI